MLAICSYLIWLYLPSTSRVKFGSTQLVKPDWFIYMKCQPVSTLGL